MRLAVLADIHGNVSALRTVLADLDSQGGADQLLVLGDIVLPGPDPAEVVEHLMGRSAIGIYGNTDVPSVRHRSHWRVADHQSGGQSRERSRQR